MVDELNGTPVYPVTRPRITIFAASSYASHLRINSCQISVSIDKSIYATKIFLRNFSFTVRAQIKFSDLVSFTYRGTAFSLPSF